jgi:hypothetical protein
MPADNHRSNRRDKLSDSLHEVRRFMHRLVEIGESVLGVLTVHGVAAGSPTSQPTAPRSVGSSTRSENGTGDGVPDLSKEDVISFKEASEMVPTDPHPSVSTISRWCSAGCRGVKLESTYYGGRRRTTRQAVERFLLRCRNQEWAGMHEGTALHLERVMAEREQQHNLLANDQPSHADRDQLSTHRADSTQRGRPKTRRKVARSKPAPRHTKPRKHDS